jgi:MFS family permease
MNNLAPPVAEPAGLWRNPNFTRLWFATLVSSAGTQITNLALPLTAALTLGATPTQMGLLAMAGSLPNLLFGLLAGVWVDRTSRKPVLLWADLLRAALLASIPLASLLGTLSFAQLWIVAFAASTLSIFFTLASVAVLPTLVKPTQLVEANSTFALSDAVLSITGPGVAGGIIQVLSAPRAIILDAFSFVVSALSLRGVKLEQQPARLAARRGQLWNDMCEGARALIQTPLLLALTVSGMIGTVGFSIQGAVAILFLTRALQLGPASIGLLSACGGGGALCGAVAAGRLGRQIGVGMAVILGNLLWILGGLVTPLAGFSTMPLPYLVAGSALGAFGATLFSVNQMSLRQHLTPAALLGRVTAARRFFIFSLAPLGSLVGGVLGTMLGLQATLIIGGCVGIVSVLVIGCSPVRAVRELGDASAST